LNRRLVMAQDPYEALDLDRVKAALSAKRVVLRIRGIDGMLEDAWGYHTPKEEFDLELKGSWYTISGCTYVNHNGVWKKVCGRQFAVAIRTSDGEVDDVIGETVEAVGPASGLQGEWYMDRVRTTCIYVNHGGVWKKVCS
jgi:hypothetical protein